MSTITPEIRLQIQTFLKTIPDSVNTTELRNTMSKLITEEKKSRASFCVMCETDIDKLSVVTHKFKPFNLRNQIKSGFIQIEPHVFEGFVCEKHAKEYNIAESIDKYQKEKARAHEQYQNRVFAEKWRKQDLVDKWIKTKGKEGKANPHTAFHRMRDMIGNNFDLLSDLSLMDYRNFLKTPYWFVISQYVRYKDEHKCRLCDAKGYLNVHHKTYEHRGFEVNHTEDLITLCGSCHSHHHDHGGTK